MSYSVRTHPRARHVRLRVEPHGAVVVTVPRGFDRRQLPALIAERQDWIDRTRKRLVHAGPAAELAGLMPAAIKLPAVAEDWSVNYQPGDRATVRLRQRDGALCLDCPREDACQAVAAVLRDWLKRHARGHLVPRTQCLAERFGFRVGRITIRNQKSRWGSCSGRGNLSLNARLLFLSPAACDYVLLHELAHTEHLNHSPKFWARVAEVSPDYRLALRELKSAWLAMPAWVWTEPARP
ncbi:MAG: M48 family peptidase [Wenzhouxiangella sp.]|nr:MAG: M48 family peptidase [Wenzhouxiangella sp.]